MAMTIRYEFLAKDDCTIHGEITNAPEFSVSGRAGYERAIKLIEAWSGFTVDSMLEFEAFNDAAAAIRERMRK